MLQPVRRRTWAPSGETPLHYAWDRHDRISAISALSLSPRRRRVGLYFSLASNNIRAPDVMSFLRQLHRHLGRHLIVVMDRYQVHRSAVRQLSEQGVEWLDVEWLPAYAPDLNPVEAVWSHSKHSELANFIPADIDHLHDQLHFTLDGYRTDPRLKRSFFEFAELAV